MDMKTERQPGKEAVQPSRHVYGPRPIGALMPAITRPAFRKKSPAAASLMSDWAAIVGPALAAMIRPRRFSAGTLVLNCTGPVALELQHSGAVLIERINAQLGQPLVVRIRFVQDAGADTVTAPDPRRKVRLDPVPLEGLPDGPLRDALAALGAEILANRA